MNEFYEDLMCPVVYRWVKNHEGVKTCHNKCCTLWIDNGNIYGVIEFHDENIVELSVKDEKSNENIFYLHFQMHDMNSSLQQFNTPCHEYASNRYQEDFIKLQWRVNDILLCIFYSRDYES